jgi:hypothetical protein
MKISRWARAKIPRPTREGPGTDVRTPHVGRTACANPKRQRDKSQTTPVAESHGVFWNLEFWTFVICAPQGAPASPPPSPAGADWLCPCDGRTVEVWTDALPQRNCGRFARPSPLPGTWKRTANAAEQANQPKDVQPRFSLRGGMGVPPMVRMTTGRMPVPLGLAGAQPCCAPACLHPPPLPTHHIPPRSPRPFRFLASLRFFRPHSPPKNFKIRRRLAVSTAMSSSVLYK